MKYKVGDMIKYVHKDYWFLKNHFGAIGQVVDHRRFRGDTPTHYVVKFDCYTIPHLYTKYEIETFCDKINMFSEMDKTVDDFMGTIDNLEIRKPHLDADFAWKVYDFINRYKAGMFGEVTLQQALDKYWQR